MKSKKGAIAMPIGFTANGVSCGIKKNGLLDLALIYSEKKANAAALFTTNKVKAWPLIIGKQNLGDSKIEAVIVNSGNANCTNGTKNLSYCKEYMQVLSKEMDISLNNIFPASTGVIGVDFKEAAEKIKTSIPSLVKKLSKKNASKAALAILTTDTKTKELYTEFKIGNKKVRLAVMAKGSGMLHPNMATMLVYFTTDCAISNIVLKRALRKVVKKTFNRISVDNDMSTNDTVLILANAMAENKMIIKEDKNFDKFYKELERLSKNIARLIVADGEGVTKVCEISIEGAKNEKEADAVARAIANSMLFKTALHGADPNWGRIIAVIGAKKINFSEEKLEIAFSNLPIYKQGKPISSNLKSIEKLLKKKNIFLSIKLGVGKSKAEFITSDLSKKYIEINAEYTT